MAELNTNTPEIQEFLRRYRKKLRQDKNNPSIHDILPSDHALRGTPLVGGGRASAIGGSQPETALLRKEAKGRLALVPLDPLPRPEPEPRAKRTRKRLGRRVSAPGGRLW